MKLNVLVGDAMAKDIKKIGMHEPIEKAAKIMRDERISSVVVTGEKNVKGIITARDIVYKHVASDHGKTVADIMSTNLITISPHDTLEEAARRMAKNRIEKLLVFDNDHLVGIITTTDIIKIEP